MTGPGQSRCSRAPGRSGGCRPLARAGSVRLHLAPAGGAEARNARVVISPGAERSPSHRSWSRPAQGDDASRGARPNGRRSLLEGDPAATDGPGARPRCNADVRPAAAGGLGRVSARCYVHSMHETGRRPVYDEAVVPRALLESVLKLPQSCDALKQLRRFGAVSYAEYWARRDAGDPMTPTAAGTVGLYEAQHGPLYYRLAAPLYAALGGEKRLAARSLGCGWQTCC